MIETHLNEEVVRNQSIAILHDATEFNSWLQDKVREEELLIELPNYWTGAKEIQQTKLRLRLQEAVAIGRGDQYFIVNRREVFGQNKFVFLTSEIRHSLSHLNEAGSFYRSQGVENAINTIQEGLYQVPTRTCFYTKDQPEYWDSLDDRLYLAFKVPEKILQVWEDQAAFVPDLNKMGFTLPESILRNNILDKNIRLNHYSSDQVLLWGNACGMLTYMPPSSIDVAETLKVNKRAYSENPYGSTKSNLDLLEENLSNLKK